MNSGVERDILNGTYAKEFYSLEQARGILELCDAANGKKELNRAFDFYFHEMRPLYLLAQILFPNDPEVRIKFTGGPGTDHDGLITHPTLDTEQKVEMVQAVNGEQRNILKEYLKKFGYAFSRLKRDINGTKHNRVLTEDKEVELITQEEFLKQDGHLIKEALEKKINKSQYQGHWLCVSLQYSLCRFGIPEDYIKETMQDLPVPPFTFFTRIFFLGCDGKTFEPVEGQYYEYRP